MGVRRERRPVSQRWSQMSVGRERVRAGGDSEGKGWVRVDMDITAICCQGCVRSDFLSLSTVNARFGLFPTHSLSHEIGVVQMGCVMRHASHNERLSRPLTHSARSEIRRVIHFALGSQIASPNAYRLMCFNQFSPRDSVSTCVKELVVQKNDFKVEDARTLRLFFWDNFTVFHYCRNDTSGMNIKALAYHAPFRRHQLESSHLPRFEPIPSAAVSATPV